MHQYSQRTIKNEYEQGYRINNSAIEHGNCGMGIVIVNAINFDEIAYNEGLIF